MSVEFTPEFTRLIRVEDIPATGRAFEFAATATELKALARRFDLVDLERFVVKGLATHEPSGGRVRIAARVLADLTQRCVVTLAPVEAHLDLAFERVYDPTLTGEWNDDGDDIVLSATNGVDLEPLIGAAVDPAEAAADEFGLELPSFPRADGAEFPGFGSEAGETNEDTPAVGPFARLRELATKPANER